MPRRIHYTEPVTTTMFGPLQLRPRTLLTQAASCLSRWLAEHAAPFPTMVNTYGNSVVVTALRIDYATPHVGFADVANLDVRCGISIDPPGERMCAEVDCSADGRPLAHASLSARVLTVADPTSLAATPGALHPELRQKFRNAETVPAPRPADPHNEHATLLLPPQEWRTFISRSHAEVADQWSFVEMVELATQARERLFTENLHSPLTPHQVIGTPTRSLHALFRRPMFVYDPCSVSTSAHLASDTADVCFHHRIGPPGSARPHLTVCEILEPAMSANV